MVGHAFIINLPKEWIESKGLSKDNIIGDISQGVSTRRRLTYCEHVAFVSKSEPKDVNDDAFNDSLDKSFMMFLV